MWCITLLGKFRVSFQASYVDSAKFLDPKEDTYLSPYCGNNYIESFPTSFSGVTLDLRQQKQELYNLLSHCDATALTLSAAKCYWNKKKKINSPFFRIQEGFGKGIILDFESSYLEFTENKAC